MLSPKSCIRKYELFCCLVYIKISCGIATTIQLVLEEEDRRFSGQNLTEVLHARSSVNHYGMGSAVVYCVLRVKIKMSLCLQPTRAEVSSCATTAGVSTTGWCVTMLTPVGTTRMRCTAASSTLVCQRALFTRS